MDNLHHFFFYDKTYNDILYLLKVNINTEPDSNTELGILETIIIYITKDSFPTIDYISHENVAVCIKDKLVVGPISSFESVFSNTTKKLLNNNIAKNHALQIVSFEKLKMISPSEPYDEMLEQVYTESALFSSINAINTLNALPYDQIIAFDEAGSQLLSTYGVKFDTTEFEYYKEVFNNSANLIELFDLCQSNSEHSRHWFFGGKYNINNTSLFTSVKSTLNRYSNSLVAFSDNSSVIRGFNTLTYIYDINHSLTTDVKSIHSVLTAETHNFPTLICPFEGASTGVGGRIRDNQSTGRGAKLGQSLAGYCVGDITRLTPLYGTPYQIPIDMLIAASNGASDYGNKIGEPIVGGFTRSIGVELNKHYEYLKPIMFSAGVGSILNGNVKKILPHKGDLVVRLGGPAYKIGLGGGFNSSIDNTANFTKHSCNAVQRGDPEMGNKLNRVIQRLSEMPSNPIKSIHDQGAGGLGNVVKEIVYPNGAFINLDNVSLGDTSMGPLEIWCSEFQESDVILISPTSEHLVRSICVIENVSMDILGNICDPEFGKIIVSFKGDEIIKFDLEAILNPSIRKEFNLEMDSRVYYDAIHNAGQGQEPCINIDHDKMIAEIHNVLKHLDVGSKRFLTTKVDRSVTGLVAQQQCVGPFQVPVSNYSVNAFSYIDNKGTVASIGERPYLGLFSERLQAEYSLVEMLTNIVGAYIGSIENIKCSVNWMWANNSPGEAIKLYNTATHLTHIMKQVGIGIDGGKDSLSMMVKTDVKDVVSPGNVVITSYAPCLNIHKGITPNLKDICSLIIYIPFVKPSSEELKLKGSIWSRVNSTDAHLNLPPSIDFKYVKLFFETIQSLIGKDNILSLHDISDGGLITTLFEMCYSGFKGIEINKNLQNGIQLYNFLFSETPGVVLEILNADFMKVRDTFIASKVSYDIIGITKRKTCLTFNYKIDDTLNTLNLPIYHLCQSYESEANKIEVKQCLKECVVDEFEFIKRHYKRENNSDVFFTNPLNWYIPERYIDTLNKPFIRNINNINKTVLVLRDEGSNGDNEMAAYFKMHGFSVLNYNMTMIEEKMDNNPDFLDIIDGIVFVGGFTYSDIMGGASCWLTRIKNSENVYQELLTFFKNPRKFVIGVCNGFQLLIKMGVFGDNISLEENTSGRFESRFLPMEVIENRKHNTYFDGMEDTIFGIWCAHKMGRITIKNTDYKFIPVLKYTDGGYPMNPNGSFENIAGVVNLDGRILGLMPHFERSFINYQCAYIPPEYSKIQKSPWFIIGQNIAKFLEQV